MCSVRCPIAVDMEDGAPRWIYGNPHSPLQGALCARGAAGIALEMDDERPHSPLIRTGERGAGQWRAVGWDEALDFVAARLRANAARHGAASLLWSDRDGPFTDLSRAFMRGMGSPNVCSHGVACDINGHHAAQAVTGFGRGMLVFDYAHCTHLILQGRNIFEAINVGECLNVTKALQRGCRLTVLDVRPTVTASKADAYFGLRPGSDYAFNLAIIQTLLAEDLYNKPYVQQQTQGLEDLRAFVQHCTPHWAEQHTGIPAEDIRALARRIAADAPHVIWHYGWMTAKYSQSFQTARTALVINALLGSLGAQGGIVPAATPKDLGLADLRKFADLYPAPTLPRADGAGAGNAWDAKKGLLHRAYAAIDSGRPYPIASYIAWRHDPLQSMPDPEALKRIFRKLDLLVSVTFSWSDTAWFADVVLPLSPYLSRESIIACKAGLKPQFFVRRRAMKPRFDTKADWEIISGLAQRLGLDQLVFPHAEAVWNYQLQGTGLRIADFAKGFVPLTDSPHYADLAAMHWPTASGKLELTSSGWQARGMPMLEPYIPQPSPPAGMFRIVFGHIGLHTQGHTVNNPLLFEEMATNIAWIHPRRAAELHLHEGAQVEVLDINGRCAGSMPLHLCEGVHPEAVFMVHGFGHRLPCESRALHRGTADQELLSGGLRREDAGGGGLALQEHFVSLREVRA